ncbi:mamu class I histocompatibility antigen, alpha chain F-like isoform X5 [Sturnira hondurensis]|uniref:mamu class I histocompatibility antigen, alpha chain F-like isoform X5 n=1 Tax=Sturnira hondurensis TaxID=192404 RepID=UPI00187A7BEE|nr:mamu class I histocompatibility antigen, alpha chain F-like isoform X5 [Sturnira hondurensis]
MKTVSAGTSARRQRPSLAAGARRSPACPSLLLLLQLVLESTAESPWALPVIADRPASLAKAVMAELANLKPENKPWPGGIHSAQRMFGCDIQEDSLSSSFWHFGFDGQDHVSLDLEALSWVSADPVAMQTKRILDSERCYAEYDKAYLESLCLTSLRRYLELGSQILTRREPPTVQVTRHTTQDRGATLRCWALGFYPRGISLSWWLGEQELALETEYVETLPSGDGTYQTWAAVQVPAGEETAYTCHVQHSGLSHVLTMAWERPSGQGLVAMVTCPLLFLLVVGVVILTRRCHQGRNKEPYEQAPVDSLWDHFTCSVTLTEASQAPCDFPNTGMCGVAAGEFGVRVSLCTWKELTGTGAQGQVVGGETT